MLSLLGRKKSAVAPNDAPPEGSSFAARIAGALGKPAETAKQTALFLASSTKQTAEKIAPKNPQILFFKGHLAQLSGETERARTAWKKLQDILDPESDAAKALEAEIGKLREPKNEKNNF